VADSLVNFALERIWCNPRQDSQYTIKPKRMTPEYGATNRLVLLDRVIDLPTNNELYHVFQIGQILTSTVNISRDLPDWLPDRWMSLYESVGVNDVTCMVYDSRGLMVPGFTCYFMYMDERNLVLAIKQTNKVPVDYRNGNFYLRVYRNTYYNSDRYDGVNELIIIGDRLNSIQAIVDFQTTYDGYKNLPGACFCYVNGYLVESIDLITAQPGDYVEFLYDPSVMRIVSFKIDELRTYLSELDNSRKFLIHYPFESNEPIEFFDDNECFIVKRDGDRYKGIYQYHHRPSAMRMVTHRDYGVSVDDVVNQAGGLNILIDNGEADYREYEFRMYIRHSGYDRSLVYIHHRLHELYKLNEEWVMESLLGTGDSTNVWRCEVLENDAYAKVMSSLDGQFTKQNVIDALGYNSISTYYANTPQSLPGPNGNYVDLPALLQNNSTVYEYDSDGKMIGWHHHENGQAYIANTAGAVRLEVIRGRGTYQPEQLFGTKTISIPSDCNYRIYVTHFFNGTHATWDDITGLDELYTIENGVLTYIPDEPNVLLMVRTDRTFLAYDFTVSASNGVVAFDITEVTNTLGSAQVLDLEIPWLQLDVFMNGYSLIENIDYRLDMPRLVIYSKRFLNQPAFNTEQDIHIRFRGLSVDGKTWEHPQDIGYIEHGFLSNNNKFDVREDQVLRIVTNGSLKTRDEVEFSEEHSGISISDARNGVPYMIRDIAVPMKELVDQDSYEFREESLLMNKVVSDYMSLKLPQPTRDGIFAIPERYATYSPFISAILFAIESGGISPEQYTRNLSDHEVRDICAPYEPWLVYDNISSENVPDSRFVIIHPHHHYNVMVVTLHAYRFLMQVIKIYASAPVELSGFVAIET
jgi:hypothetical protein